MPASKPAMSPPSEAEQQMPPPDFVEKAAGGDVPVPLLWALAYHESSFRPWLVNEASHATGVWQITAPVLKDYNEANKTAYTLNDMKHPELGVLVAGAHLRRILKNWTASRVAAVRPDFGSQRFVGLLVFGWNSGPNAVRHVASLLEAAGVATEAITVELVQQAAAKHLAALSDEAARRKDPQKWVASPDRAAWAKGVAATFGDLLEGRKMILATIVTLPDGFALRKMMMGRAPAGAAGATPPGAPGVVASAPELAPGLSRATAAAELVAATVPRDRASGSAPANSPEVDAPSSSGIGTMAGMALAVLGLGGAAAVQAAASGDTALEEA